MFALDLALQAQDILSYPKALTLLHMRHMGWWRDHPVTQVGRCTHTLKSVYSCGGMPLSPVTSQPQGLEESWPNTVNFGGGH